VPRKYFLGRKKQSKEKSWEMKIAFKQCIQKNFVAHLLAHAWAPRINTSPAPVSEHPGSMTRAAFTDHVNPYTTSRPVADFFLKKHFLTKT